VKHIALLPIAAILLPVFAAAPELETNEEVAKVYERKLPKSDEKPIYTANIGEILILLERADGLVKVRTQSGLVGWVKGTQVKPKQSKTDTAMVMDEAKVIGFLENPQAVYILDMTDPDVKPIKLDRSFKEFMIFNIDKETFQRIHDKKLKPEE